MLERKLIVQDKTVKMVVVVEEVVMVDQVLQEQLVQEPQDKVLQEVRLIQTKFSTPQVAEAVVQEQLAQMLTQQTAMVVMVEQV